MLTRNVKTTPLTRAALVATIAAFAVTMSQPSMAASVPTKTQTGVTAKAGTSDVTDFISQRRRYGRGGGYGGAAVGAAVAGIVGTAIIASQANRGYGYGYGGGPYDSYAYSPGYGGGPGYYDGGPSYYGGGYGRDRSALGGQGTNGQLLRNW